MKKMKKIADILLVFMLAFSSYAPGNDETQAPEMSAEQEAMMEAWVKHATPGEHHKHLAMFAGTWKISGKMYMDSSTPPVESSGTCEYTMSLGGRFLSQKCVGESMGQPFEGWGITGYDNMLQKHTALWMDNMGTSVLSGSGTCEQGGKVIKISGEYPDPVTGRSKAYRYVVTIDGENSQKLEWFEAGQDGKEFLMMEMQYTR